jgi:hypothetical protein
VIRLLLVFVIVSLAQIFGDTDDRRDVTLLRGRDRAVVNAVVTLVGRDGIINVSDESFRLMTSELRNERGFCADENFSNQRALLTDYCSGVLIAPDVIATAGHCVETEADCRSYVYVFGYNSQTVNQNLSRDQLYECQELLHIELDEQRDAAFIKLDRPVIGVTPLSWRRSGSLAVGDQVYTVGSPYGLPLLRADGEILYVGENLEGLSTDIDSFSGNSGGPVLNSRNHEIEGILVGGEPIPQSFYDSSARCFRWEQATPVDEDTYRPYGFRSEIVTRTRVIPVSDILHLFERYGRSARTGVNDAASEALD